MLAHHLFPINQKYTSAGNGSDESNADYRQNGQPAQLKLMSLFMDASRALVIVLVLLIPSPLLANMCLGFGQLDTVLSFPSLTEGHRRRTIASSQQAHLEHWCRWFAYPPRKTTVQHQAPGPVEHPSSVACNNLLMLQGRSFESTTCCVIEQQRQDSRSFEATITPWPLRVSSKAWSSKRGT
jgi:hypothetical protein